MTIEEVIKRADDLYPNHYERSRKLEWCYEVTATAAETVTKLYESCIMQGGQEEYILPPNISIEDVRYVYADGRKLVKTDERSFFDMIPKNTKEVRVVYKVRLVPYRDIATHGTYAFGSDRITVPRHELMIGDNLNVTVDGETINCNVLDLDGNDVITGDDTFTAGEKEADIVLAVTDETLAPPPYDSMYVDFVIGKIAYYQNDMEEYNKQMTAYNDKLYEYSRWYKQTNPIDKSLRFVGTW